MFMMSLRRNPRYSEIDPFQANVPLLYPVKTFENRRSSEVFRVYWNRALAWNSFSVEVWVECQPEVLFHCTLTGFGAFFWRDKMISSRVKCLDVFCYQFFIFLFIYLFFISFQDNSRLITSTFCYFFLLFNILPILFRVMRGLLQIFKTFKTVIFKKIL